MIVFHHVLNGHTPNMHHPLFYAAAVSDSSFFFGSSQCFCDWL